MTATNDDGVETSWVAGRDHSDNPVRLAVRVPIELRRLHFDDASAAGLWAIRRLIEFEPLLADIQSKTHATP
jgi:hypothetical protein